jgi:protoheme IX farnesyltransferase
MTSQARPALWRDVVTLVRLRLSVAVALTSLPGFLIAGRIVVLPMSAAVAGVFLLACAASAINQIQERALDATMARTRARPLPMQHVSVFFASVLAAVCGIAGVTILICFTTAGAGVLGLGTLVWYNAVYTPLKTRTRFSLVIGAFTGALPPIVGSVAAGGPIVGNCLIVSLFMFLWQMSHFKLLLVKYGGEYEKAGLAYLAISGNETGLKPNVFVWCVATSISTALFPITGLVSGVALLALLIASNALFLSYFYVKMIRARTLSDFRVPFLVMYLFQGFVLALVIVGAISRGP